MTEQQFKILCRAYWPDCHFADTSFGDILCYPDMWARVCYAPQCKNAEGWFGEEADWFQVGKPETIIRRVAEDMRRWKDVRTEV